MNLAFHISSVFNWKSSNFTAACEKTNRYRPNSENADNLKFLHKDDFNILIFLSEQIRGNADFMWNSKLFIYN